jgi:hypothetical protein
LTKRVLAILILIRLAGCASYPPEQPAAPSPARRPAPLKTELKLPDGEAIRVLFIGNSLTFFNDLPAIVQSIAASLRVRLEYRSCTMGGANLEDHWRHGKCRIMLGDGKWDYVVLQQGPSSLPASRVDLRKWTAAWNTEIRKHGAKTALYMVWPFKNQKNGFRDVSQSYSLAASDVDGLFLPAGDAWYHLIESKSHIQLYSPDDLHPTREGTVLAALIIAGRLTGETLKGIPNRLPVTTGGPVEISAAKMQELLRAATQVLAAKHSPYIE